MKTFRVEISTFMILDAVDALSAIDEARYHFMQTCKVGNDPVLAREASYDAAAVMCPKCYSPDCRGALAGAECERQVDRPCDVRRVPVIQRDRE